MKLIIIGAGPGGYETALEAAAQGVEVTLINGGKLGGTCLNEGCIPTKCMVRDAAVVNTLREAGRFAADNVKYDVDYNKVLSRRDAVVSQLRDGIATMLSKARVNVVDGMAVFRDDHTVTVNDTDYSADNIIIATGSHSRSLPIPGADQEWVLDSSGLLALEFVPAQLVIVGGGVIGMEFASIFASFGSEVTVIEYMKQILPPFDSDISKRLKQTLSKRGINIITGAAVKRIEQTDDYRVKVSYDVKGEEKAVETSNVMVAVGRGPNVENLGLDAAGVQWSDRGIPVDDNFRTNIPHIYAVGDVNARMALAHVATAQGRHALNHILGRADNIRFDAVPSAVFTDPECGMCGLTEEQCKSQGMAYETGKGFFRANGKAMAMGETDGLVKLIFGKEDGRLLGAHIMGPEAALLAQQCNDMMSAEMTRTQIRDLIFGHPTLSEVILTACL